MPDRLVADNNGVVGGRANLRGSWDGWLAERDFDAACWGFRNPGPGPVRRA